MAQMIWVNREGKMLETAGQPQAILQNPRLSPDGTRIAVDAQDPDSRNIWVHELERRTKMRLTFDQTAPVKRPLWIHGRDEVAYSTGSGGEGPAFVRSADGSGEARKLPISNPTSCSRDGKFLLFGTDDGDDDIGYVANDDGKPASLIVGENEDRNAEFSPDGTLLAYEHRDAGAAQEEIFLTTFPSAGGRWQVSINSGTAPRWSPRGDEIFYIEPSSFSLMSVAVTREPKLTLGSPRMLFSGLNPGVALYAGYDVSDDAQRFVMVQISDPEASKQGIAVVQNWFTEFQQRP
jgi:serine/threonine-protein kinase